MHSPLFISENNLIIYSTIAESEKPDSKAIRNSPGFPGPSALILAGVLSNSGVIRKTILTEEIAVSFTP
jgi:hypothetical protein